jgi:Mce-associated membrane protein
MTEPERAEEERRRSLWLASGTLAGVVVAVLVIAVLLISGNKGDAPPAAPPSTASDAATSGPTLAADRDESMRFAEEAVVILNTLDYRTAQQGLDRWESVATAPLLDQLRTRRAEAASTAEQTKTASTAKVLAAALSRFSPDASGADVLAAVEVTTVDEKGAPTVKTLREKFTLLNTGQGWKVSAVAVVEPAG